MINFSVFLILFLVLLFYRFEFLSSFLTKETTFAYSSHYLYSMFFREVVLFVTKVLLDFLFLMYYLIQYQKHCYINQLLKVINLSLVFIVYLSNFSIDSTFQKSTLVMTSKLTYCILTPTLDHYSFHSLNHQYF